MCPQKNNEAQKYPRKPKKKNTGIFFLTQGFANPEIEPMIYVLINNVTSENVPSLLL